MKINTDPKIIDEILSRSVVEILPSKEGFKELLLSGKQIRVYIGTDATGPSLHLGHATNYMILEKLRKLGHKVIFLIGDFTARIGDPTDKTATRVQLTREQVGENTKTWLKQLEPIVDIYNKDNPVEIVYNHDWLSKMTFEDVIELASNFTVQQMLERDMFEKRMKENKPIYVHEFFYPLMQGYDSVHLDVDMEMCGNDQKFNALTGRILSRRYKNKEKFVLITTLLENPITKEKMMSKSLGTGVFLNVSANDMFGKIMSQPDENIPQLFMDCTYVSLEEVEKITKELESGLVNPRDVKFDLASAITEIYHGKDAAINAKVEFINTFQKKEITDDLKIQIETKIDDLLFDVLTPHFKSKSELRRLFEQGAVREVESDEVLDIETPVSEISIRVGKRQFFKIKIN